MVKHLGEALQQQMGPVKKARLFGLLFDRSPTYADLAGQTPGASILTGVNPLFLAKNYQKLSLVSQRESKPNTPEELFSALIELGENPLLDFAEDSGNQLSFFCSCTFCEEVGYA